MGKACQLPSACARGLGERQGGDKSASEQQQRILCSSASAGQVGESAERTTRACSARGRKRLLGRGKKSLALARRRGSSSTRVHTLGEPHTLCPMLLLQSNEAPFHAHRRQPPALAHPYAILHDCSSSTSIVNVSFHSSFPLAPPCKISSPTQSFSASRRVVKFSQQHIAALTAAGRSLSSNGSSLTSYWGLDMVEVK